MPSVQWNIHYPFQNDSLRIIAFCNHTAGSAQVLQNYTAGQGIAYPMVFDQPGEIFDIYNIGIQYGTDVPGYIIIDKEGIVRYRYIAEFDKIEEIKGHIEELLSQESSSGK